VAAASLARNLLDAFDSALKTIETSTDP